MIWKIIPDFPDYKVNNKGDVLSFKRDNKGKLLKPSYSKQGYKRFCIGAKRMPIFAHRLVLIAFIGKPKSGQVARHLNGDKLDNRVKNLKWGTVKENHRDAINHGTWSRHEKHGQSKLDWGKVNKIRCSNLPAKCLAIKFNVHITTINRVKNYTNWNNK